MDIQTKTALITSLSVISGIVISQNISLLLSRSDKKYKKHQLLRQKYEEMMFEFQGSLIYVQEVHTCRTRDQLFQLTHSPQTEKAYGLALLYFPNLVEPLKQYILFQVSFYNSAVTLFNQEIPANVGGQAIQDNNHNLILNDLQNAKNKVMEEIISNTKKYTKA